MDHGADDAVTGHARFERDALAHVLGGLGGPDSDAFRAHLRTCADCRTRVAELRGISSTLDAAAREERRRAATAVTAPPDVTADRRARPADGRPARALALRLVAVVVLLGVGFWTFHLRTQADVYYGVAEERGAILRDLAAGTLLDDPALTAVQARVAVTPTRVVLLLADAGPLDQGEQLVGWLLPGTATGPAPHVLGVGPGDGGELAVRLPRSGARTLIVTREVGPPGGGPGGVEVLRVTLPHT